MYTGLLALAQRDRRRRKKKTVGLAVRHGWAQGGSAVAKPEEEKLICGACCGTGSCMLACKACSRQIEKNG